MIKWLKGKKQIHTIFQWLSEEKFSIQDVKHFTPMFTHLLARNAYCLSCDDTEL
jgi:hypothetical protein